jgi:oxaloacetate decarboxylase gamma subunit
MTIAEMFGQSGILALIGMSVVFGFLIIMIISVTVAGKILHALGLDKEPAAKTTPAAASGNSAGAPVIAAISAAVQQYRGK